MEVNANDPLYLDSGKILQTGEDAPDFLCSVTPPNGNGALNIEPDGDPVDLDDAR